MTAEDRTAPMGDDDLPDEQLYTCGCAGAVHYREHPTSGRRYIVCDRHLEGHRDGWGFALHLIQFDNDEVDDAIRRRAQKLTFGRLEAERIAHTEEVAALRLQVDTLGRIIRDTGGAVGHYDSEQPLAEDDRARHVNLQRDRRAEPPARPPA